MAESPSAGSPTPVDTIEIPTATHHQDYNSVTPEQWTAMKSIIEKVYAYREPNGNDPSKLFHRKVNKRLVPDYYDVIKEPVALSTLKQKSTTKEYTSFAGFVRDAALISHNAQTYNRPDSRAYQDALTMKGIFKTEVESLADEGIVPIEVATLPDLGELPPVETHVPVEEEEDEEDEDDDDEDDEDDDESDDEGGKRKRKRGPRSTAAITKREGGAKDDRGQKGLDADPRKRRGRPPRVDTPMESRIKNVLKAIRKYKNNLGQYMISEFKKVPDKTLMPEYYIEIKEPMDIQQIKKKQKRKKYQSVDHFLRDIDVMFNNAKSYNEDESQLYKDAAEAHKLADAEKQKPDTDFADEEGRIPLPSGILHNGELWKVGDWIHIQNPNDVTKPIVAQIYRTWQDTDGEKWVNACWYYRPEQTVHQYEKHFFPNEVVKTGQYRDHRIDEIVERCFVMFTTRYSRGRPRGLGADKEVYVCDSRYNEERHKLNKIKTWASCLPDEVRDKDYEMDLFDGIKKVKKIPSPILHLLKEDTKESDELPKPRWGADNAPPIVGAVFKGPRDENQSPPPEPTPSPPPPSAPPAAKAANSMSAYDTPKTRKYSQGDAIMEGTIHQSSTGGASSSHNNNTQGYNSALPQHQHSASPAPIQHPHQYAQQASNTYSQSQHASTSASNLNHYSTPTSRYVPPAAQRVTGAAANAQCQTEVWHLPENANLAIPEETRNQFQQDANGHVLFWTAPPGETLPSVKPGSAIGHTARYLADKIRAKIAAKEKRKAEGLPEDEEERDQPQLAAKRIKQETSEVSPRQIEDLKIKALQQWNEQMQAGTDNIYKKLHGQHWEEGKKYELEKLAKKQADHRKQQAELEAAALARRLSSWEKSHAAVSDSGVYKDDLDPRY